MISDAPGINASSPRPNPNLCLATGHYLLCQCAIGESTRRRGIIVKNGLPEARSLAQTNVAADNCLKCLFGKVLAYFPHDLSSQTSARIKHRQDHAGNIEIRIELALH